MPNRDRPLPAPSEVWALSDAWQSVRMLTSAMRDGTDAGFLLGVRAVASHPAVSAVSLAVAPATEIGITQHFAEGTPPSPPSSAALVRAFAQDGVETGLLTLYMGAEGASAVVGEWAETVGDLFGQAIARRRREYEAIALQRAEIASALSAAAAHDLNNVMTAVIGTATLLQLHEPHDDEVTRLAQQVEQVAWGGSRIARELIRFVRGLDEPEPAIPVGDILSGATLLAAPLLKSTPVEVGEFEGALEVPGVRVLLEQAVVNLLLHHGRSAASGSSIGVLVEPLDGTIAVTVRGGAPGQAAQVKRGFDLETARLIAQRHGGTLEPGEDAGGVASHVLVLPLMA